MCLSKPQAPGPTRLPPPPPPPPNATPMSPVFDPATKDKLLLRPRSRGLKDLTIPLSGAPGGNGLNVPQG